MLFNFLETYFLPQTQQFQLVIVFQNHFSFSVFLDVLKKLSSTLCFACWLNSCDEVFFVFCKNKSISVCFSTFCKQFSFIPTFYRSKTSSVSVWFSSFKQQLGLTVFALCSGTNKIQIVFDNTKWRSYNILRYFFQNHFGWSCTARVEWVIILVPA